MVNRYNEQHLSLREWTKYIVSIRLGMRNEQYSILIVNSVMKSKNSFLEINTCAILWILF